MRNRGNVFDHANLKARALKRTNRSLTAGARSLYKNFNRFHPVVNCNLRSGFSRSLRGKGSGLSGASEAKLTGACPGNRITLRIRNGNNCIVKCRLNMCGATVNIFALAAAAGSCSRFFSALLYCHLNKSLLTTLISFY